MNAKDALRMEGNAELNAMYLECLRYIEEGLSHIPYTTLNNFRVYVGQPQLSYNYLTCLVFQEAARRYFLAT